MFRTKFITAAVVAAVALLASPAVSQAKFTVTLTVGAQTTTITGVDAGGGKFTVDLGTSYDVGPSGTPFSFGGYDIGFHAQSWTAAGIQAQLKTTTQAVIRNTSAGSTPLVITVKEDNFSVPSANGTYNLENILTVLGFYNPDTSNITGGSDNVQAYASASPDSTTTPTVTKGVPFGSGSSVALFHKSGTPFTMSQTLTISIGQGDYASFQSRADVASAVPAPAGLVLFATALPFAGVLRLRRRLTGATA